MIPSLLDNFNTYIKLIKEYKVSESSIINIDSCKFLTPTIISPLLNYMLTYNKKIKKHHNENINAHFHRILGLTQHKDTTLPFRWLNKNVDNSEELTKEILKIMNPIEGMHNALKYIFHEVISNVYDHSEFNLAFVLGQNYPKLGLTDFCFMDNGVSIPGSFREANFKVKNDCDSIIKAINGFSTKDNDEFVGRGTGLNSIINIVNKGAKGDVLIVSGDGLIEIKNSNVYAKFIPKGFLKGTLVSLRLSSNKPIDIYKYMDGFKYKISKNLK